MAKVTHLKDICIGCGACVAVCPKYWEMKGDGKSHLKGAKMINPDHFELVLPNAECNGEAASSCPVSCIKVVK
jgi:ferredoxin